MKENMFYRQISNAAANRAVYWTSKDRQIMSSLRLQQTVEFIAEQAAHNARVAITMDRLAKQSAFIPTVDTGN